MRFLYLLFLVYCLKQTSVVNSFEIAGPLLDSADLYKETAKLNSDLLNNIEPLLSTYEDAFDEIIDDFSEKIQPLLQKINIHICDRFESFKSLNETKNLFKKTLDDFNLSNLTAVCSDKSLISNVAAGASSIICDDDSLIKIVYEAETAFHDFLKNITSLRDSTANLLNHKRNNLTTIAYDKIKDWTLFPFKFLGWELDKNSVDHKGAIEDEVFKPLDKCLKLVTTVRAAQAIDECYEAVSVNMTKSARVIQLKKDLDQPELGIYTGLLEEYEILIKRVLTIFKTINNKMISVSQNIFDKFLKDEKNCFGKKFLHSLLGAMVYRDDGDGKLVRKYFESFHYTFKAAASRFDSILAGLKSVASHLNIPENLHSCESGLKYAGEVRNVLCKMYDKTSFIFDKATNKIMKPIEKIESFIPCFVEEIGAFALDKAEKFLDEAGIKKIYDDVEEEISNIVDDSVSILKPFFEEFGSGCVRALEAFENSIKNLHNDIQKCEFIININQLSDACSKPVVSIENSRFINKKVKELPESALQLKACVQEKIATKGEEIYKSMQWCKKIWNHFFL